jgi:hypothetical protein
MKRLQHDRKWHIELIVEGEGMGKFRLYTQQGSKVYGKHPLEFLHLYPVSEIVEKGQTHQVPCYVYLNHYLPLDKLNVGHKYFTTHPLTRQAITPSGFDEWLVRLSYTTLGLYPSRHSRTPAPNITVQRYSNQPEGHPIHSILAKDDDDEEEEEEDEEVPDEEEEEERQEEPCFLFTLEYLIWF